MRYTRLWARVYNAPLLIHPDKARVIEEVFRGHLLAEASAPVKLMEDDGPTKEEQAAMQHEQRVRAYAGITLQRRDDKPYALTTSGVALIPVLGTLIQRGSWLDSMSGLTSYNEIATMMDRALSDQDVRGIMLEIDSPGGEAFGLIDIADRVYAARQQKPVWAHANEQAYSAAYWLAASAARVYAPITGGVGSIGAVMLHVDQSKRDTMMGLKYTFVYAGAHKVDGNSHEPLNADALQFAQSEVDRHRDLFAQAVAKRRNLSTDAVLATEAALLTPPDALEGGYLDGVNTLVEAVTLLDAEIRQPGSTQSSSGTRMAAHQPLKSNPAQENQMKNASPAAITILAALGLSMESVSDANGVKLEAAITQHADAARTEARAEGEKAGETKGHALGLAAGVTRVRGILAHAEAKDRPQAALSLALEGDMNVEQAGKILAGVPKQGSGAGVDFGKLMAQIGNPKVGVDTELTGDEGKASIDSRAIFANRAAARQQQK